MQKCATIWLQMKLTITEYSLTTTWTATSRRKEHYTWNYVCVVKPHDTNDNVTTKTQSTFHTKHMNIDTWVRSSLVCFVSQVLVVMIHTLHRMAQVSLVRVTHARTCSVRIFSTLSPPFSSSSSSHHSSSTSCTSSCSSSTTLRAVQNCALRLKGDGLPWRLLPPHMVWPQSCSTGTLPVTFLAKYRSCVDSLPRRSFSRPFSRICSELCFSQGCPCHCSWPSRGAKVAALILMRSVTTALLAHAAGKVKKRAASTEQIVAHIFLEAGAIVRKNMYVRDMNVDVGAEDGRQMEVSAQNLFCYGGVQFAVDITLRSVCSCARCKRRRGSVGERTDALGNHLPWVGHVWTLKIGCVGPGNRRKMERRVCWGAPALIPRQRTRSCPSGFDVGVCSPPRFSLLRWWNLRAVCLGVRLAVWHSLWPICLIWIQGSPSRSLVDNVHAFLEKLLILTESFWHSSAVFFQDGPRSDWDVMPGSHLMEGADDD